MIITKSRQTRQKANGLPMAGGAFGWTSKITPKQDRFKELCNETF